MGFILYMVVGYILKLFFFNKYEYDRGLDPLFTKLWLDNVKVSREFFNLVTKWFPILAFVLAWPLVMGLTLLAVIVKGGK